MGHYSPLVTHPEFTPLVPDFGLTLYTKMTVQRKQNFN